MASTNDSASSTAPLDSQASAAPTASTTTAITPIDLSEIKVWNPPVSVPGTPASAAVLRSLPDSYFDPTAGEIKAAYQSQHRLHENLVNAPLRTQAIREKEEKERASRWPQTKIRIKFPNQLMLERTFPSTDKIRSVYAFVRNSLTEEAKPIKFVLYQAPPRRDLKVSDATVKNLTLGQLQLAPSAILHLTFEDESLNGSTDPPPLLPSIMALAQDLPPPPTFDPEPVADDKGKGKRLGGGSGSTSSSTGKAMPKWLKLPGGKK